MTKETKEFLEEKDTKSHLLSKVIKITGAMTKSGLNDLLTKTLEVTPDEGEKPAEGAFDSSVTAVNAAVAEDVKDIFKDSDLSEEFKAKASTLFEAAVNARLDIERTRITEELEQKFQTSITEALDEIHENVQTYINYVAEEWYKENQIAVESDFKVALSDSLLEGLKKLFNDHNIEVPVDNTENVVEELTNTIEVLLAELNEAQAKNIDLEKVVAKASEEEKFEKVSEGLVATEVEKFKTLTESIEYASLDEYEEKLKVIRQQYFNESAPAKSGSVGLINEDVVGDDPQQQTQKEFIVPDHMKHYVAAISKTVQK